MLGASGRWIAPYRRRGGRDSARVGATMSAGAENGSSIGERHLGDAPARPARDDGQSAHASTPVPEGSVGCPRAAAVGWCWPEPSQAAIGSRPYVRCAACFETPNPAEARRADGRRPDRLEPCGLSERERGVDQIERPVYAMSRLASGASSAHGWASANLPLARSSGLSMAWAASQPAWSTSGSSAVLCPVASARSRA